MMEKTTSEDLLWELSRLGERQRGPLPPDATLRAYLDGLPEEETRHMEALLADNPAARARLMALAGVEFPAPPAALRKRMLHRPGPERGRWMRPWALAAALKRRALAVIAGGWTPVAVTRRWAPVAALAASLLLVIGYSLLDRPPELPEALAYRIVGDGMTRVRSAQADRDVIEAYPDTPVRIAATPREHAPAGLEFGLYHEHDGRVERLAPGSSFHLETQRGTATFTALAADLVGKTPGSYRLFVVVAWAGDLPEARMLNPGETPGAVLAEGSRRLVYRQLIKLLPATEREPTRSPDKP